MAAARADVARYREEAKAVTRQFPLSEPHRVSRAVLHRVDSLGPLGCPARLTDTVGGCLDRYVDANVVKSEGNPCYRCGAGAALREQFAERADLSEFHEGRARFDQEE